MADRIPKNAGREAGQTEASVWNAICYFDSPTDYREYLSDALQESDFVVLDNSSGFDWCGLRDLVSIALLVSIIVMALRS